MSSRLYIFTSFLHTETKCFKVNTGGSRKLAYLTRMKHKPSPFANIETTTNKIVRSYSEN